MENRIEAFEGSYGNPESSAETSDERLATYVHLQQLQQKQENVHRMESETAEHVNAGFRRGLEELVRDHLNTCMALATCSSSGLDPGISSSNNGSNLMSRHASYNAIHDDSGDTQRSIIENDDTITAYNTAQSHGDISDSYENRGSHESEVPVLQMRDSSYRSAHHDIVEREHSGYEHLDNDHFEEQREVVQDEFSAPERPRSRILSMWAAQHAQEMMTTMERQAREAELLALAGLHTVSTLDASFLRESLTSSDSSMSEEERQHRRPSSMVQMWRELEEERRTGGDSTGTTNPSENARSLESRATIVTIDAEGASENQYEEVRVSHSQENNVEGAVESTGYRDWEVNNMEGVSIDEHAEVSNEIPARNEEGEREHVRQIVERLTTDNRITTDNRMQSSDGQTRRSSWLDENERERVRELARAWVRVTNEQGANMQEPPGGRQRHQEHTRERMLATGDESYSESPIQGLSRRERRFLNRQAILDLLMRVEAERQRELELLVEHRAVSDFAHRHRLQSFLRGRFLRTGAVNDDGRVTPSAAAGELGQLRQRRAVSHMREGFRFRLESILRNQANNRVDTEHTNSRNSTSRRRRSEDPHVQPSPQESPATRWTPSRTVPRGLQENPAVTRVADFQSMEESNEYNMELQELLGRRSVTNVLASDFRERLDRLIRSFLQSQGGAQVGWDLSQAGASRRQGPPAPPPPPRQQWQRQQPAAAAPPPPPPPPQLQWQQELQGLWPRPSPSLHRSSYLEGEGIADLRNDVSKLQQGMSDLHKVMETCLEMQLDLQRSLRQELAGALQQMYEGKAIPEEAIDGSKWVSVKRGICVVCCDRNIDSLLYRCGHMCTCLNCASELLRKSGKCPMCRAPIKEVVRAFTVA